jgi:hypothetical protein
VLLGFPAPQCSFGRAKSMSIQTDKRYLEAGIPELENYLLSKELYYPIGRNLSQLTLGGVLLSLKRLPENEAGRFEVQVNRIYTKWRSAWDTKAGREVRARSELWKNFLAEYPGDPEGTARLYPQQVRYRAMLTLLGELSDVMDVYLRSIFEQGDFVWEPEVGENFSEDIFWFLFGTLKSQEEQL